MGKARGTERKLEGWGRFPTRLLPGAEDLLYPRSVEEALAFARNPYLARGLGRSYGDASLPAAGCRALETRHLDRLLSFDRGSGLLEAEAGISFRDILKTVLPHGFFLPVTPGTQFVSLGGALASNVHGKNHHLDGSLENFVEGLEVETPDQGPLWCSAAENAELFRATVGGYGWTGLIRRARLRLRRVETGLLAQRVRPARNLAALFAALHAGAEAPYSVAWIDALAKGKEMGRGLLYLGRHAKLSELPPDLRDADLATGPSASLEAQAMPRKSLKARTAPRKSLYGQPAPRLSIPLELPDFAARLLLNSTSLGLFNRAYFGLGAVKGSAERLVPWEPFFYPLDRLLHWNRLYGKKGFFQYQCVLPDPRGEEGVEEVLTFLSRGGFGAFLSVLKRCGDDHAALPFCRRGFTLALDLPHLSNEIFRAMERLDALVLKYGGRIYLTKDARLSPAAFRSMYPEIDALKAAVRAVDKAGHCRSRLSERLGVFS